MRKGTEGEDKEKEERKKKPRGKTIEKMLNYVFIFVYSLNINI